MIGGDVKTLYPSLDIVSTSQIAAQAIRDTNIKFGGLDYDRLSVYLTLTLGDSLMGKCGLYHIIPSRTDESKVKINILSKAYTQIIEMYSYRTMYFGMIIPVNIYVYSYF